MSICRISGWWRRRVGAPRRFTAGPKRDRDPRWSPDGTRLAFVSEREGKKKGQLYVMPADGGEPMRLTDERHGVAIPFGAPTDVALAFVARVGGWQEPEREEDKQKSRPARVITTLKYRFNGEGFTYDRRRHVFVVAAAGGPARQITDGDWDDADPAWSPDGRLIAFSLGPSFGPRLRRQRRSLGCRRGRAESRGVSPIPSARRSSPRSRPTAVPSRISAGARRTSTAETSASSPFP